MRVWERPAAAADGPTSLRDLPYVAALRLVELPHDDALARIFEDMAVATDADRAWMLEYSPDLSLCGNSCVWSRDGLESHLEDVQNTPVTIMGELHQHMMRGNPVLVPDVEALARPMRSLRVELMRQSVRSALHVPVHHDGQLRGILGLDATRAPRRWGDEVVATLVRLARLIAAARYGVGRSAEATHPAWPEPVLYVRTGRSLRGVALDAIVLVRADGDGSCVFLDDGAQVPDLRPLKW